MMLSSDKSQSHSEDVLQGMLRLGVSAVAANPDQSSEQVLVTPGEHVLIVDNGSPLVLELIQALRRFGAYPLVLQATALDRPAPTIAYEPQNPLTVEQALTRLRGIAGGLAGVIFLSTYPIPFKPDWYAQARQHLRTAIAIVRGANLQHDTPLKFVYFITAQGGRFGIQSQQVDALAPGLEAIAHPLSLEMPKTSFRSIDLDPATDSATQAQQIFQEFSQANQPYRTAYGWAKGQRATLSVAQVNSESFTPAVVDSSSVVVFAGGARGIGAVCAKALAAQAKCKIVFLGRTPLTDDLWALSRLSAAEQKQKADEFIKTYKAEHPGCPPREPRQAWKKKQQALEAIETLNAVQAAGGSADYFAVDVRDRNAVLQTFQAIHQQLGRIDVVVHVAGLGGVETDRMLMRKDWDIIDQVLDIKVIGALHLLKAAETLGVKLFLGFGSIASRFGNTGQVDYAAANGLLTGIARAHNAQGKLPVARVLAWGAWDGVGMAVSGPTKDMLLAYGLKFITPEAGAACFLRELVPHLDKHNPDELYLSPTWAALTDLLEQQQLADPLPEMPHETVARAPSAPSQRQLMGDIVVHTPQQALRAEHLLDAKAIPFLNHHRYDGTAWVPAVMGMEVSVEAASALFPNLQAFALRDVKLIKAVRLVRDEPVLLITDVKFDSQVGDEVRVQATVSATFKKRTWVFAEMQVVLSDNPDLVGQRLGDAAKHHSPMPIAQEPGTLITQKLQELYDPAGWLKFQLSGPTFQVLQSLQMNCDVGRTEGVMVNTADVTGCLTPLTFIDGVFQAYGVTLCTIFQSWAGPPLFIGEIAWSPAALRTQAATYKIRTNLEDKVNFPILHLFNEQGDCILRMQRADQGGTSLKDIAQKQQAQSAPPSTPVTAATVAPASVPASVPAGAIATPYLGDLLDLKPGTSLIAEKVLDPQSEILLLHHKFYIFIVVPAVYFMEVAAEAATRLQGTLPCELQDFTIHQALHLLKDPQILHTEATVIDAQRTQVKLFSRREDSLKLHAEGIVVHGTHASLGTLTPPSLENVVSKPSAGLYPHRFPNGPIFQVIEQMDLGNHHHSRSQLRLTIQPEAGCLLPITLLDGAFQVDSATRSGFDKPSGLPRSFATLKWLPTASSQERVTCFSSTGGETTDSPGELFFVGEDQKVQLQMTQIVLTPVLPSLGNRS